MDFTAWPSLTAVFFEQAAARRDDNFLWSKTDGVYQAQTWGAIAEQVKDLTRGLRDLGLQRGDRVVLVAENRPEWLIADLAIMAAGAISVPAYTTNLPADHLHILTNSGAVGAIVSTRALAQKLMPAVMDSGDCQWVVAMEDLQQGQAGPKAVHLWQTVMERGRAMPDDVIDYAARAKRGDTACIIYTSGTGGVPRGVMLSHGAMICNCMGAYELLKKVGLGKEVFLCFLPLSHAYEHTAGQFFPITIGAEIYYAEGVENLLRNLGEARPTILTAVPRLYESMHLKIRRNMEKEGGLKAKLFAKAEDIGRRHYLTPEKLTLLDKFQDFFLEILVRNKIRGRFGGRIKAIVSGGAALNFDIGLFFTALGLPILQGYGQTETAPVVSANPPWKVKLHTVGPPFKGVEVKIADDGEILIRGELVMNGYWRDETATAQVMKDGWLHTGDIGKLDEDGYLMITDRKKDIIVFSGGDNVSPARVEGILTLQTEIIQAMVYGDKRPNLVAALVPDDEFITTWAAQNGKPDNLADLTEDPDFRSAVSTVVDKVNKELSPLEKIRRFTILPQPFTVENGMMTPTLKIRRHKIREAYGAALEALYEKR
ncbi:long-chain fatty acid--CoA ligase [Pelagibius litoralis]|uniref:Long-chain fatty acid--CoA ligase n=1 Tax=Pelagibius litoralis TaxID=374515 RepID=A0A967C5H9_9PROT|nr:long-chain fatty acid--CoA ligase [Pelagibius litoralis]NIA69129.1 long-chain fatty acid--CoA ligase [Pelagibius litoralis]